MSRAPPMQGCPSVRLYGRTDESILRLVYWLGRFLPVTNLANTADGNLEGELHCLAINSIVHLDGLYLTVGFGLEPYFARRMA